MYSSMPVILAILLLDYRSEARQTVNLPDCVTITTEVIVPTETYTFLSTEVITEQATTAEDLGTFTEIIAVRTTYTVKVLTSTVVDCYGRTTFTNAPTITVYTSTIAPGKRQEPPCTIVVTSTTTYGATYTWIPANETSTYTQYTDFILKTVSQTTAEGTSYTIGTAYSTACRLCGPTIEPSGSISPTSMTQDARCAPTAITSAAGQYNGSEGFGISYLNPVPLGGATFNGSTSDASACCQLCAQEQGCAASAFDIRTSECMLMFAVQWDTGILSCGQGVLAFYDYGPNHPMKPGTGWYLANGCGYFQTAGAKPDDGS